MSTTSSVNAVQVLFYAEDAAARDRANGTFTAREAADSKHYLWHGTHQTIPMGMEDDPEGFASGLRTALPAVTTLRLSFNAFSFNADGSLHTQFERFLTAAAAQGFDFIFTYSDGQAQRLGADGGLTSDQMYDALSGSVGGRMKASWSKLMAWMDDHADVRDAVYGYELVNEPASYERGVELAARGTKLAAEARFVDLYARQMADLADMIDARHDGRILVGGWGYSGRFEEFAENTVGSRTALDFLRESIGEDLVWSAHFYAGWRNSDQARSVAELEAIFEALYAPLGDDDILLTETTLPGHQINDFSTAPGATWVLARSLDWFAENGIGITWYSGAEAGAGHLVTVDPGQALRFLHQHSYAFAMQAFSLGEAPARWAGNDIVHAALIEGRLRNEGHEADSPVGLTFDAVTRLGLGFGHGGHDRLYGSAEANNMLYGGQGNDTVLGAVAEDFLFGQAGDDVLRGAAGRDLLYGGDGADLLVGGAGDDTLEGGAGADRFDVRAGSDLVVDFRPAQGDRLFFGDRYTHWRQIEARMSLEAVNGPGANDVVIRHDDRTLTVLIDAKGRFGPGSVLFAGTDWVVDGTDFGDRIQLGYTDHDGDVFTLAWRRVAAGGGADTVTGGLGSDSLAGGAGNDVLRGGAGHDVLSGDDGHDLLHGEAGNDTLRAGGGADTVFGGDGDDLIVGTLGSDRFHGGAGDDILRTGQGFTRVWGDAGNDRLVADLTASGHLLTGGAGRDTFVFVNAAGAAVTQSRVTDFRIGTDRLEIDGTLIDFVRLPESMTGLDTASGFDLMLASGDVIHFHDLSL